MTAIAHMTCTAFDCPDPRKLAGFYAELTGWPLDEESSDDEWVQLASPGPITLAFQRVAGFRPPQWPGQEVPQQLHCDFRVADLDAGEQQVLALGATKHDVQPGTGFRVYLDPVGHPFCLVT